MELDVFERIKLSHFGSFLHYRVINYYSFLRILNILCIVGNIKKICIWLFNIDKNNFDKYAHLNLVILSRSSHYWI